MKINKNLIIGIIIGGILFGGVGVAAAATYFNAKDIAFTPKTESWAVTNVQEAMDSLYDDLLIGKELIANAITEKGISTSNADSFDKIASNIYSIDTIKRKIFIPTWYALLNGSETYLIFDTEDYSSLSIESWTTQPSSRKIYGSNDNSTWKVIFDLATISSSLSNLDISEYNYIKISFGNNAAVSNRVFATNIIIE